MIKIFLKTELIKLKKSRVDYKNFFNLFNYNLKKVLWKKL